MSILKFKNLDEVVERANKTVNGLAAGVCTREHRQGAQARQGGARGHGLDQLLRPV
jgi:acyl-CoA reductase-like NAD-dependent aldehyde dehydrogenase